MFAFNFTDFLDHTVSVERPTNTASAIGTSSKTWATILSGQAASIQPSSGAKALIAAQLEMVVPHTIYFASVLDVRNGDRINDGTNLYVVQWIADQGGNGTVFSVLGELLRP